MKPVIDPYKAMDPGAPVLRTDKPGKQTTISGIGKRAIRQRPKMFSQDAEVVVKATNAYPTHPCVFHRNLWLRGRLSIRWTITSRMYMTTQAPHAIRTVIALVAGHVGLTEEKIRVISPDIGGGFGGKVPVYPGYVIAIAVSFLVGKPVKWIEDSSENLQADSFARDYHITAEMAGTKEGKILATRFQSTGRSWLYRCSANPSKFPTGMFSICTGSYDYDTSLHGGGCRVHQ